MIITVQVRQNVCPAGKTGPNARAEDGVKLTQSATSHKDDVEFVEADILWKVRAKSKNNFEN